MPMVGHIAQTGQIVATDFKAGNVLLNVDNLGVIKTCQDALSNLLIGDKTQSLVFGNMNNIV
jgi:hypothetical protein